MQISLLIVPLMIRLDTFADSDRSLRSAESPGIAQSLTESNHHVA